MEIDKQILLTIEVKEDEQQCCHEDCYFLEVQAFMGAPTEYTCCLFREVLDTYLSTPTRCDSCLRKFPVDEELDDLPTIGEGDEVLPFEKSSDN